MKIFDKEDYYGKVEYKRYFNVKDRDRLENYITQMNYRMNEGNGKCIYLIGVNDNGSIYGLDEQQLGRNKDIICYICQLLNFNIDLIIKSTYKDKKFLICKIKSNEPLKSPPL